MANKPEAIFFDVDGVLIDSLASHLNFCKDEAARLGLSIKIPSVAEFRDLIRSGTKVSPMRDFFVAVGFPQDKLDAAEQNYNKNFSSNYPLRMFDGVPEMLATLHGAEIKLGLITSNVKENVESALGNALKYFEPSARFFLEQGATKAKQIEKGAVALKTGVAQCLFVGDQPADEAAAKEAGSMFLGVTYGWGFGSDKEEYFEVAENAFDIPMGVQRATLKRDRGLQFDYTWKWFYYHADQRIKMFNYMFLGLGLFATAIVGTVSKQLPSIVPIALCFFAGMLSLIFALIDKRNKQLLRLSEEILTELEKRTIFGSGNWIYDRTGTKIHFGILSRQQFEEPSGGRGWFGNAWLGKHRIWLPTIAVLLATLFFIAGALIWKFGLDFNQGQVEPKLFLLG